MIVKNRKFQVQKATNMIFILPAIVLNIVFLAIPLMKTVYMSLFDWKLLGDKKFIFLDNFVNAFRDETFVHSLVFTFKYAIFVTPCLFLLAFVLALLVKESFRGAGIFRTVYFAPVVISMTTCSMVWMWIYNDMYGILNYILVKMGVISENISWMNKASTSLPAIVFMITWKMAGFTMLMLVSAFQAVDGDVYEAASMDGAGKIKQFFKITLPLIRSYVGLAMVISVIGSVLAFEQFSIMTKGGPSSSTLTAVHYIYNTSFKYFKFGYGSSLSLILLAILLILSYFQFKVLSDPTV